MIEAKASSDQIRCISVLIRKLGMDGQKDSIISGATDGRTTSRGGLFRPEAIALIKKLKELDPDEVSADVMRKKMISRMREMGWMLGDKPDMIRIDDWCKKSGYLHKGLNSYTLKELPRLVTQFEEVYKSFLKAL